MREQQTGFRPGRHRIDQKFFGTRHTLSFHKCDLPRPEKSHQRSRSNYTVQCAPQESVVEKFVNRLRMMFCGLMASCISTAPVLAILALFFVLASYRSLCTFIFCRNMQLLEKGIRQF